jgi:hypothetical protein
MQIWEFRGSGTISVRDGLFFQKALALWAQTTVIFFFERKAFTKSVPDSKREPFA